VALALFEKEYEEQKDKKSRYAGTDDYCYCLVRVGQFHKLMQDFQTSAYMCACVYAGSVRFVGLFAGQKLLGLNPTKCPAKIPATKNSTRSLAKIQTRTTIFPPLRSFLPGQLIIEIPYSDVIKDISIIIWPAGESPWSGRNMGVQVWSW